MDNIMQGLFKGIGVQAKEVYANRVRIYRQTGGIYNVM